MNTVEQELIKQIHKMQKEIDTLKRRIDKMHEHDFDFCSMDGCEGVTMTCWKDCPRSMYNQAKLEVLQKLKTKVKDSWRCGAIVRVEDIDNMVKEILNEN